MPAGYVGVVVGPGTRGIQTRSSSRSTASRHTCGGAVDHNGTVLDIVVCNRRNTTAARRLFGKLCKTTASVPRVVITDKLGSYGAALREVMPSIAHRSAKYLNNRAESPPSTHPATPTHHERLGTGVGAAQRLLASFSRTSPHLQPRRHLLTADDYPTEMTHRFTIWNQATGLPQTA
jgi:putative transposase